MTSVACLLNKDAQPPSLFTKDKVIGFQFRQLFTIQFEDIVGRHTPQYNILWYTLALPLCEYINRS